MPSLDLERTILVGTDTGLFKITGEIDSTQWHTEKILDTGKRSVRGVAYEPTTDSLLVGLGCRGAGLLVSRDGGNAWRPAPGWSMDQQAWGIAVPGAGRVLVGGEPPDVWHGQLPDGGWSVNESIRKIPERSQWDFIRPPHAAHILSFSRHPGNPMRWLAAVEQGGIIGSDDDGITWRQVSPTWDAHVVLHLGNQVAIAVTGGGIFRSPDDGTSWTGPVGPSGYATGLALDTNGTVWAAIKNTRRPLYCSTDSGLSWSAVEAANSLPEPGHGVHALVADPVRSRALYYGSDENVWLVKDDSSLLLSHDLTEVRRIFMLPRRQTAA